MTTFVRLILIVIALAFAGCSWDCNASTCLNGCCDASNTCILNGGPSECGVSGQTCRVCQTCEAGVCGCGPGLEMTSNGCACTARSCASGCCESSSFGSGTCRSFSSQSSSSCGTGGATCSSCSTSSCAQGRCVACVNYFSACTAATSVCCSNSDSCRYSSSLGYTVCQ